MNTQHGFQRIGFSAATGLGVERLDQAQQTRPGHDLIHLGEEAFAACLLALAGVFEIGKAHLAHRRLGSGGQAYFSTFENLFGDSLEEDLFPSDYLITDLTRQDFRGSKGFSNTQLERTEPGTFQELDIIYLLQRAYTSERIIHGPLKVSDGEELADVVVMGDEVTLLLQAKDSPNTPATLNTTLERKRKKAIGQLKNGLQQLRGAISTIKREGNPALALVDGTPLDIDLAARPLVGVVVVREFFIDNYDEYSTMILKFMDEVGVRVLAFDYNEFEVMTRHCPSEDALLSAFFQISKCAEERRIYPRLRFTDLPPR